MRQLFFLIAVTAISLTCSINISAQYVGEYKDGKMHGQGTYTWPNGDKYIGEWKYGKRDGYGIMVSANGERYEGEWKNDKKSGFGTMFYANGDKYEGNWKYITSPFEQSVKSGQGTMYYANGDVYDGKWRNGGPSEGVFIYADKTAYVGTFFDSQRRNGKVYSKDGEVLGKYKKFYYLPIDDKGEKAQYKAYRKGIRRCIWGGVGQGLLEMASGATTTVATTFENNNNNFTYRPNPSITTKVSDAESQSNSAPKACLHCKGTGICSACNGSGQSAKTIPGTNIHKNCESCHNKKICKWCKGKGTKGGSSTKTGSNTIEGDCKDCRGTGTCHICEGTTIYYVAGTATECWRCNKTGKCQSCKGKGKR